MDQVDKVLWDLKHDPGSRRILTSLYNHHDLSEMALYPCAYSMTFNVSGNTLNGILNQRSQDMLTANGWNVMQYAVLLHMVAQVSGLEAGELVHVIADKSPLDAGRGGGGAEITPQPPTPPFFPPAATVFFLRLHPGRGGPGGIRPPPGPCAGNDPGGGLRGGAQYGSHCGSGPELGHREGRRAASHLSQDLKRFKALTLGHAVILGRRTLSTFPGGRP